MEVLKSGNAPALVTNLEVMKLLQDRIAARQLQENDVADSTTGNKASETNARKAPFQNRDWIEQTCLNHLQSSPIGGSGVKVEDMTKLVEHLRLDSDTSAKREQNDDDEHLANYGLTKAETLQILNHLPSSLVEVHLLIEDIEKRKHLGNEEKQTKFLGLVSKFSGRPVGGGVHGA